MSIVQAICPNISEENIHATPNHERWFKVVNGKLNIPTDHILRGNFVLMDKLIEALHSFELGEPEQGYWDDSKVNGKTYYTADECMGAIDFLKHQKVLAVDIESRDTGYDGNKVLLIGFAYNDYDSIVTANFEPDVLGNLQLLFWNEDITFI